MTQIKIHRCSGWQGGHTQLIFWLILLFSSAPPYTESRDLVLVMLNGIAMKAYICLYNILTLVTGNFMF